MTEPWEVGEVHQRRCLRSGETIRLRFQRGARWTWFDWLCHALRYMFIQVNPSAAVLKMREAMVEIAADYHRKLAALGVEQE